MAFLIGVTVLVGCAVAGDSSPTSSPLSFGDVAQELLVNVWLLVLVIENNRCHERCHPILHAHLRSLDTRLAPGLTS